ncbi:sigma-70 family RNA polymerase sigma factor [Gramella sp. KN1008]|nr:sigma-70 family RNA polymerase sigma factor [Gramella sp. KN1008]
MKKFEKISDSEITSRILSGDTDIYEVIIRRYNPYLFKIGRSYGFNQPDTEDLMQEAFIKAYTNLERFENRSSLKTWLVKIMLNECYHKKQKFSYKNEFPTDFLEKTPKAPMFSQKPSNTSKTVMNNELKHILENAIVQIPGNYRMVFTLRELNGMSTKETAKALEISESNVKIRLKRAKAMLQTEIKKMYSPEEIFEFNLIYCNRIVENVFSRLPQKSKSSAFSNLINLKKWLLGFMSRPNGRA